MQVLHSRTLATPVQLLAQHMLWGQELAEVYAPSLGRGLTLHAAGQHRADVLRPGGDGDGGVSRL
jgi:hypothetical protein